MRSGAFLSASVSSFTRQKPMPLLEASVSSRVGSFESKWRRMGPAGLVMISLTLFSPLSCASSRYEFIALL